MNRAGAVLVVSVALAKTVTACGTGTATEAKSAPTSAPNSTSVADGGKAAQPDAAPDGGRGPSTLLASRGANVDPSGGVTFRVWAPHATAAWVAGDFPEAKVAMTPGPGGTFEAHIAGASAGSLYNYGLDSPSGLVSRVDPYCRELTVDRSACRVIDPKAYVWKTPAFTRPARGSAIVYEMHVGSFTPEGTLDAARVRLADLADLGVNVVELMPVHTFGAGAHSWGYNPQLWLTPRAELGTSDALRAFVDAAHQKGIAVWIDLVVNHADGWAKAPLRCFDGDCPDGSAGIYFFASSPYANTPWGPRPNYAEPESAGMLLASVEQWLTEFRGDGFRWDSVANIRALDGNGTVPGGRELLTQANDLTHALGAMSVAEDLKGWDGITTATATNGLGFDAQWDGFGYDLDNVIAPANDDGRDMSVVERVLLGGYAGDAYARLLWTENHDTVGNGGSRLPTRIDPSSPQSLGARRRSMLASVVLFTTPGVPMLFMGQEALAVQSFLSDPVALESPTPAGTKTRAFYKDMIALRRSLPGLQAPEIEILHRNDSEKVIAFRRGDVVVIVNFRNKAYTRYDIGVPSAGPYHVRLDTESKAYGDDLSDGPKDAITTLESPKDGKPFTLPIALPAYAAMVLTP